MSCIAAAAYLDREQMIVSHLPQVKLIAQSFRQRCPPEVLLEDLVSVGTIGLIHAVDRFDPSRNLKLKTIAEHRIRGAMLDYLRQLDPLPRTIRQFARQREEALSRMEERRDRVPSDDPDGRRTRSAIGEVSPPDSGHPRQFDRRSRYRRQAGRSSAASFSTPAP